MITLDNDVPRVGRSHQIELVLEPGAASPRYANPQYQLTPITINDSSDSGRCALGDADGSLHDFMVSKAQQAFAQNTPLR